MNRGCQSRSARCSNDPIVSDGAVVGIVEEENTAPGSVMNVVVLNDTVASLHPNPKAIDIGGTGGGDFKSINGDAATGNMETIGDNTTLCAEGDELFVLADDRTFVVSSCGDKDGGAIGDGV